MDDDGSTFMVEEPSPGYIYTYADYLTWKFEERLELFRGEIFRMSSVNTKHQLVLGNLHLSIGNYLEGRNCKSFIAPYDIRLPVKNRKKDNEITTVLQPDLCIVCDPDKIDERGVCGAPDLVIEILSPGNSHKEVRLKFELYEEAGVREYWIVHPVEGTVVIYYLDDTGRFGGGKIYASGDIVPVSVVPGLKIDVSDIFNN